MKVAAQIASKTGRKCLLLTVKHYLVRVTKFPTDFARKLHCRNLGRHWNLPGTEVLNEGTDLQSCALSKSYILVALEFVGLRVHFQSLANIHTLSDAASLL